MTTAISGRRKNSVRALLRVTDEIASKPTTNTATVFVFSMGMESPLIIDVAGRAGSFTRMTQKAQAMLGKSGSKKTTASVKPSPYIKTEAFTEDEKWLLANAEALAALSLGLEQAARREFSANPGRDTS